METDNIAVAPAVNNRASTGAIVLFVLAALGISAFIIVGQVVAWNLEQTALADETFAALGNAGRIWFLVQALIVAVLSGIAVVVSKSVFRPVYCSWLIAALITLPAWGLRFLGPNNDQVGASIQIILSILAAAAVLAFNGREFKLDGRVWFALAIVPLGVWPFLLWGALGSGTDTVLNLLAGLAFGLLAASLSIVTESNYFLNGLGIGVLLALLG